MKMVNYKAIKTTIDVSGQVKIIMDMMVRYHGLLELIISDHSSLFTSKFGIHYATFLV